VIPGRRAFSNLLAPEPAASRRLVRWGPFPSDGRRSLGRGWLSHPSAERVGRVSPVDWQGHKTKLTLHQRQEALRGGMPASPWWISAGPAGTGWRESCSQCSIDEDLLALRFHEAFRRLRSLGSIDGCLLPRQRRNGVRKQLRAEFVSDLQSKVLGPVRGSLYAMRSWRCHHLQHFLHAQGRPLTRNAHCEWGF
jgi:hypothetical protein